LYLDVDGVVANDGANLRQILHETRHHLRNTLLVLHVTVLDLLNLRLQHIQLRLSTDGDTCVNEALGHGPIRIILMSVITIFNKVAI